MKPISDSLVKNPCIRDCKYDDDNVCITCLRTKKEVFYWGDYSNEEKLGILNRIKEKDLPNKCTEGRSD